MGKPKLPRGKMPPGTRVHTDRKKEANKKWCRDSECDECGFGCPDKTRCIFDE
jgi:hypothetical protein